MEVGIVTEILNTFIGAFSGGFDRMRPAVGGLLRILVTLDVLFFAVLLLFELESVKNAFRKLLVLSLWTYVIQDFDSHATSVVNSLVQAGLMAAGQGGADPHLLLDPSRILDRAFEATQPLANNLLNAGVLDLMDYFAFGVSYVFVMLAFGALALNAFLVVIEYYLALAVAGILLPFGVLGPTRWLAMKPISFLVSSGLKLMVISFVMAVSGNVLGRITFATEEPSLREVWIMVFTSGTLAMVAWIAPQRLAAGFMAGAASLGGADAMGFGASVAGGAVWATSQLRIAASRGRTSMGRRAPVPTFTGGAGAYPGIRSHDRGASGADRSSGSASSAGLEGMGTKAASPLTSSSSRRQSDSGPKAPELVPERRDP